RSGVEVKSAEVDSQLRVLTLRLEQLGLAGKHRRVDAAQNDLREGILAAGNVEAGMQRVVAQIDRRGEPLALEQDRLRTRIGHPGHRTIVMKRELEAALHRAGQCETLRRDSFQRHVPGPQLPMRKFAGPRIFPGAKTDFPAYLRSGNGRAKYRAAEPEPP